MIFQGGGVSKIFGPILHFQLMTSYWPPHLGCVDLSSDGDILELENLEKNQRVFNTFSLFFLYNTALFCC